MCVWFYYLFDKWMTGRNYHKILLNEQYQKLPNECQNFPKQMWLI